MTFDPQTFMSQTIDEPLAHVREMVPEGEYLARIDDFNFDADTFKSVTVKKGTPDEREATIFNPLFVLDLSSGPEGAKEKLGRDEAKIVWKRGGMWLDFKPGTSDLDTGANKNVDLGALRKALGQESGDVFGPLRGAGPLRVRVAHRQYDNDDPEKKVAEVVRVAPA